LVVERHGGADLGHFVLPLRCRQLEEPFDDGRQLSGPVAADHHRHQAHADRQRGAAHELLDDGDPLFGGKSPVAEGHPEVVVGVERASEPEEVVLDRAALLLGPRDLEERLGVRLDPICLRHAYYRLPFPFPTWPM